MKGWRRTYWVVFFANLVTAAGMMSFLPFFPAVVEGYGIEDEGLRAVWSGVLFGAAPLSAALMGPVWGSLGDRLGRKPMVVRALCAITVFVGAMAFATTPWQLLALRLGQGVFSGFVPPSLTLVSVVTPRALQGRVTGTLQTALPAGMITGPLIGAWIQSVFSIQAVFLFVSLAAGAGALAVAFFAREDPRLRSTIERFSPTSMLAGAFRDLRALWRNEALRFSVGGLFCVQFALGTTNPILQLLVEEVWPGDPARVETLTALLFSALAVAAIVATPLWGRFGDTLGHRRVLHLSAGASFLLLGLHAAVAAYAVLFSLRVLLGLSSPGTNTAAFAMAAVETRDEQRGTALGAVFSARSLAVSSGALCGGGLASLLGVRGLFLTVGVGMALAFFASSVAARRTGADGRPASRRCGG